MDHFSVAGLRVSEKFWSPLLALPRKAWPGARNFFSLRFRDPKVEANHRDENWVLNKVRHLNFVTPRHYESSPIVTRDLGFRVHDCKSGLRLHVYSSANDNNGQDILFRSNSHLQAVAAHQVYDLTGEHGESDLEGEDPFSHEYLGWVGIRNPRRAVFDRAAYHAAAVRPPATDCNVKRLCAAMNHTHLISGLYRRNDTSKEVRRTPSVVDFQWNGFAVAVCRKASIAINSCRSTRRGWFQVCPRALEEGKCSFSPAAKPS
jgi:hypothetical protein